ncbi:MAG: hypothetical protein PHI66_03635 [Candidatus Pacebacteria bacterium]|nr:hypothetical protein [Candidatus Paceibacterota bacterium]
MISKRKFYIILVVFLGALVGDIVYDAMEISYLDAVFSQSGGWYVFFGEKFFTLRPLAEIIFDLAGAFLGYHAGKIWWRIIYVEDRRRKSYKQDW